MPYIRRHIDGDDDSQEIVIQVGTHGVSISVKNLTVEQTANLLFQSMAAVMGETEDATDDVTEVLKSIGGYKDAQ
jgi:hypothetical protein